MNLYKTGHSGKQAHFLVALMKALNCYDPPQAQDKLALLLSRMARRDKVDNLEVCKVQVLHYRDETPSKFSNRDITSS